MVVVLEGEVEGVRGCLLVEDRECGVEEGVVVRSEVLSDTSAGLLSTLRTTLHHNPHTHPASIPR